MVDSKAWLLGAGISDDTVPRSLVRMVHGTPFCCSFSPSLGFEVGGKISDLPAVLSNAFIAGFLYERRILDRVINYAVSSR